VFLNDLATAGSLPALAATVRFAGARQRLIAHNIANIDTPDFRPADVDPAEFQQQMAGAIADRRARSGGVSGRLPLDGNREVIQKDNGDLVLTPSTASGNILFHDRNNRDLERTMQQLVENAGMFRVASDLLRSRGTLLRGAIGERVL